jgi:hypothetical protein
MKGRRSMEGISERSRQLEMEKEELRAKIFNVRRVESLATSCTTSLRSSPTSTAKAGGETFEKPYTVSSAASRTAATSNRSWSTPHLSPVSNKSAKASAPNSTTGGDHLEMRTDGLNKSNSSARRELSSMLRAAEARNAMLERSLATEEAEASLLLSKLSRFQTSLQEHGLQHPDAIRSSNEGSQTTTTVQLVDEMHAVAGPVRSSFETLSRGESPLPSLTQDFLQTAEELKSTLAVRSQC